MFETLDSRNRYAVLYRIEDAKKPETRERLAKKFVEMLAKGETIHRPRTQALADRDAFEDRGAYAALRELGEERLGLDQRTESVHTRLVDTWTESTAELRGNHREHRARRDRGALDDSVDDAVMTVVLLAPHLDSRRAPLAVVAEAATQPCALRWFADEHADARRVRERVDEQRAAAGDELQSRPPIGSGNHTSVSPCGCSSRQPPSCHERTDARRCVPNRRDAAGPAQPTRATRIVVDGAEHLAGVGGQHVGETGREPAPSAIVDLGALRVRLRARGSPRSRPGRRHSRRTGHPR